MLTRSILIALGLAQICAATPIVSWDLSKSEKYPHLTPLKGKTVVSSRHAQADSSTTVSDLSAGGSLNSSTYQSQARSLNLATFRKNGESGYLEFSLKNESLKEIHLKSIEIEAMPNGPNSPRSLVVKISCDDRGFRKFGTEQFFHPSQQRTFSSLNFQHPFSFKKKVTIRIQSPTSKLSTGNLHFRKLIVNKVDDQIPIHQQAANTANTQPPSIPATLINIGGISIQLR